MNDFTSVFTAPIQLHDLQQRVPAAFTGHAAEHTSSRYIFISTKELVGALLDAGFIATHARQSIARDAANAAYARHLVRFQHQRESVTLLDAIPQIVLINSHDGRCAYQLRAGLYRPVCANGLLARIGDFGLIHVAHRGDIVRNVVEAALELTRGFTHLGEVIARMHARRLELDERARFAQRALEIRYPGTQYRPIRAEALLEPRRAADSGDDLWRVFNRAQENLLRGGIAGITAAGRATRSYAVRAIRSDVHINNALWQLAMSMLHSGASQAAAQDHEARPQANEMPSAGLASA